MDWWRSLLPSGDAQAWHRPDLKARFGGLAPTGLFDNAAIGHFVDGATPTRR